MLPAQTLSACSPLNAVSELAHDRRNVGSVLNDQPQPGRSVLELLRGHWTIERQINPGGRFTGHAVFTQRSSDSLLYHENGRLVLDNDGTTLEGENSYVYALRNGNIDISFADGPSKGKHFLSPSSCTTISPAIFP
jgi:hypothetical protein